ncbi:hypothetical protein EX30DRAFT_342446 [Ascodesmis nigricans]|uniref:Uncharacterized protein n=1 Tax=Ascodesmis nigricans TaxID=341454 RepID=A0A4V3SIA5_9PEZI|nr:hypothetical protein EX30DRAFT_342446 [Ascodesmis nigricans]
MIVEEVVWCQCRVVYPTVNAGIRLFTTITVPVIGVRRSRYPASASTPPLRPPTSLPGTSPPSHLRWEVL